MPKISKEGANRQLAQSQKKKYKKLLLVLTDVGEEIDDEITLYFLREKLGNSRDVDIYVYFVNGNMQSSERMKRAKKLVPIDSTTNIKYIPLEKEYHDFSKDNFGSYNEKLLLQIGPLDDKCIARDLIRTTLVKNEYTYILLGAFGTTLNSKGSAEETARMLSDNASKSYIVNSKVNGKLVVPSFTYEGIENLPDILKNEVIKLGYKNTVGRAPTIPFTRHLSGGPTGANYMAVNELYKAAAENNKDISTINQIDDNIMQAAENYMNLDNYYDINTIDKEKEEKRNTAHKMAEANNQKVDEQVKYLAIMTQALHEMGLQEDIPNPILYSDNIDITENTPKYKYAEGTFYYMEKGYGKYKSLIKNNTQVSMTPAYDLVAGYLAYLLVTNQLSQPTDLILKLFKIEKNKTLSFIINNIGIKLLFIKQPRCFRNEEDCIAYINHLISYIEKEKEKEENIKIATNIVNILPINDNTSYAQLNNTIKDLETLINTKFQKGSGYKKYHSLKKRKTFGYNNRVYTVYKNEKKQNFIRVNNKVVLTKDLVEQKEKPTKKKYKHGVNGKTYQVYQTLDDKKREFIKIAGKRKYVFY